MNLSGREPRPEKEKRTTMTLERMIQETIEISNGKIPYDEAEEAALAALDYVENSNLNAEETA
jgi:hypothetical protein